MIKCFYLDFLVFNKAVLPLLLSNHDFEDDPEERMKSLLSLSSSLLIVLIAGMFGCVLGLCLFCCWTEERMRG